jgi:hypothetical protein
MGTGRTCCRPSRLSAAAALSTAHTGRVSTSSRERRAARVRSRAMSRSTLVLWWQAALSLAAAVGCVYLAGMRQHPVVIVVGLGFLAIGVQCARNAVLRARG